MVAVGEGGTILTRTDGGTGWTNWTPQTSPTPANLYSIDSNYTNYIAVGAAGTILKGTPHYPNNIDWLVVPKANIPTTQDLYSIEAFGGLVAVGAGGTILKSTNNGGNWTLQSSGTSQNLYSVYFNGYLHIAVGAGGTILKSMDGGDTWTLQTPAPTTQDLYGIAVVQDTMTMQNSFVVVGAGGTILISTDNGNTWNLETHGTQTLYDIAVVQEMMSNSLVIVGAGGTILKGTNNFGMWSWDFEMSSTSNTLRSIIKGTDALVAVGHSGTTVTKGNMDMSWIPRYFSGTTNTLRDIAWNGSAYTAVGDSSTILRNYCGTEGACSYWAPQRPALNPEDLQTIEGDFHGVVGYGVSAIVVGKDSSGNGLFLVGDGVGWQQPLKDFGYPVSLANKPLYDVTTSSNGVIAVGDSINSIYWGGTYAFESEVGIAPLRGVSWSGENYVAVGNNTPNGKIATGVFVPATPTINWTQRTSPLAQNLNGIAWTGTQFVAVGNAGAILTSSNGIGWTSQTSPTTQNLFGVIWTGNQFVTVGNAGTILASPNGTDWTLQTSPTTKNLYGIAWSGKQLVAVGAGGTILTRNCSWGGALHLPANRWTQISLPAQPPSGATVEDVFGPAFIGYPYDSYWVMYELRNNLYQKLPPTTPNVLQTGTGYWIKSLIPTDLSLPGTATATSLVTGNPRCPSKIGCYATTLSVPTSGGAPLYNLVGMPLPYPVAWWDARIEVDGNTTYTLSAASEAGYADKYYAVYNGNSYDVYDDATPGQIGISQPFQGFWIAVKPGSIGHVITLLIPVLPKLGQAPAPADSFVARAEPAGFWQRLLDILIAPAAADPLADTPNAQPAAAKNQDRDRAKGKSERDAHNNAHGSAIQDGLEWYVRLIVEDPATGMGDRGNVFGQLADSVAGYDQHDLKELSPFGKPYLTLVFPHSDWGGNAGDYTTDYRSTDKAQRGAPAANWSFEIRTDQIGRNLQLRWEGPDAVLKRSVLFDEDTGTSYPIKNPHYAEGIPVAMPKLIHRFTWRYVGKTQGKPGKGD